MANHSRTFSAGQRFRYDRVARLLPAVDDLLSGAWLDPEHRGEGFMFEGLWQWPRAGVLVYLR